VSVQKCMCHHVPAFLRTLVRKSSFALKVSPIVVDRDDVAITYGSINVHPPAHCNYYFRDEAVVPIFAKTEISQVSEASTRSPSPEDCTEQ